jgi:hypothetical protein
VFTVAPCESTVSFGADVILDEVDRVGRRLPLAEQGHVMVGRHRVVRCLLCVERQAQRHAPSLLHEAGSCDHVLGGQQVQRAALVVGAPAPPV